MMQPPSCPAGAPRRRLSSSASSVLSDASTVIIKQEPPDLADTAVPTGLPIICALQGNAHDLWSEIDAEEPSIKQEMDDYDYDYPAEDAAAAAAPLLHPSHQVRVKLEPEDEDELELELRQRRQLRGRSESHDSVEEWSAWEQRKASQSSVQVKAEPPDVDSESPRPCPRVTQHERYAPDEDEEARRKYFCGQEADGFAEEPGAPVVEEKEEAEKPQYVRPARESTTLLRACKAKVHPDKIEEIRRQVAEIKAKRELEHTSKSAPRANAAAATPESYQTAYQTACPKSTVGGRPTRPEDRRESRPSASASPPSTRVRPVDEKPSMNTSMRSSPSSEPGAARRPGAAPAPAPAGAGAHQPQQGQLPPRPVSDASSSSTPLLPDSEGGKRRLAHKPPAGFFEESERPRDPRLYRRQSPPISQPQLLDCSSGSARKCEQSPPARTPGQAPARKVLLPTPPDHLRLYQPAPAKRRASGDCQWDLNGTEWEREREHTPTRKDGKRDESSVSQGDDVKRCRLEEHKPALKKLSPARETPLLKTYKRSSESPENEKPPPPPSKKRVLPPATRVTNYDTRSPLYDEYEEPRKSYNSETFRMPTQRDRFLYTICGWKPAWFQQSEVVGKEKFPQLLSNGENYEKRVEDMLQFSSGDEYCKHFNNGLFLDLWNNLCKITLKGRKQKPILIAAEVDGEPQEIPLLGHIKRRTLTCHCGSDDKALLCKGDLVIVSALKNTLKQSYFAYVVGDPKKTLISDTLKMSSSLSELCPGRKFKLSFPLMVVVKADNFAEPQKIISIEKVKDITDDLETFSSLQEFLNMNLSSLVLQPQYIPLTKSALPVKYESELNREQRHVLQSIVGEIYERPSVYVVQGGPGTGKSYLAAVLAKELSSQRIRQKKCFVILSSQSNQELNVLASKLRPSSNHNKNSVRAVWCGSSSRKFTEFENLKDISINNLVMKNKPAESTLSLIEQREQLANKVKTEEKEIKKLTALGKSLDAQRLSCSCAQKKLEVILLESKINEGNKPVVERNISPSEILKKCDVLLTTFSPPRQILEAFDQMRKGKTESEKDERVVLIVDNASEVVEPTIIKTIVTFKVTDVVLFGDTKQHVPFVPYMRARNSGLDVSLLERYSNALKDKHPPFRKLSNQFRLHPVVFNAVKKIFYDDDDDAMKCPENVRKVPIKPYIWFNCSYIDQAKEEVHFLEKLLKAVCRIEPYNTSKFRLESIRITSLCPKVSQAMVNSSSGANLFVNSNLLNSSEFDIVILSLGQATRERAAKIITAWTRAKRSLLIVGNFDCQSFTPPLSKLLEDAQLNKNVMTITNRGESPEELAEKIRV